MMGNFICFFVFCRSFIKRIVSKDLSGMPSVSKNLDSDQDRHQVVPMNAKKLKEYQEIKARKEFNP